jgi:hypothetical protein
MKKLVSLFFLIILFVFQVQAQLKTAEGKVHAFKDLQLNKIQVVAKKAKTEVLTDTAGYFKIQCDARDKLEFSGEGFLKESVKLADDETNITVKLIFKGGSKSQEEAVASEHASKEALLQSIALFPEYNFNYFNYPDIFTLIDKVYQDNYTINVHNNSVFVKKDNHSNFSGTPAIYIVNGRAALEINDILPSNVKTLKVTPDGSKEYGPRAVGGVVKITTM